MNKIGLEKGVVFGLYSMSYYIYVHDPALFLHSYIPQTFPGIRYKKDFTNYGALLFLSVTEHIDLDRKSSPCNDDPDFNFQLCVRKSLARKIGCKLPWDLWTSDHFPVCSDIDDLRKVHREYANIPSKELKNIVNRTECPKPCRYKEYKLVGEEQWHFPGFIFLTFAKEEVVIEKEMTSYSGLSLLADIGGSLGMCLGFSFLMVWDGFEAVMGTMRHVWRGRKDALK